MRGYPKEKQDSLVRRTAGGWTGSNHEWPLQGHPYDRNCGPGRQEQHATICLSSRCWHSSREAAWGSRRLEPRTWIFPRGSRGWKRSSLPHTWFHRLLFENASVLWFGQSWIGFLSTRDTKSCREVFQKVGGRAERRASLVAQMVKNLPEMWEAQVLSLSQENPLVKGMATHSTIFAWRILWTEEPGRLQSMGSQRVGHNWVTNTYFQKALLELQSVTDCVVYATCQESPEKSSCCGVREGLRGWKMTRNAPQVIFQLLTKLEDMKVVFSN